MCALALCVPWNVCVCLSWWWLCNNNNNNNTIPQFWCADFIAKRETGENCFLWAWMLLLRWRQWRCRIVVVIFMILDDFTRLDQCCGNHCHRRRRNQNRLLVPFNISEVFEYFPCGIDKTHATQRRRHSQNCCFHYLSSALPPLCVRGVSHSMR